MATNDKLIKDLVIKVKGADLEKAATSAQKLSKGLEDSAAGGEILENSLRRVPESLKTALDMANSLKKTLTSKISNSLVGQFGTVNNELKAVTNQLQTINKLSSGAISFKGLGTASNQAAKLASGLLDAGVSAEVLAKELEDVQYQLIEANSYAEELKATMASASAAGSFDRIENQLKKLNDTLEMVLGEVVLMGEGMENSSTLMLDRLDDVNTGSELVRRTMIRTAKEARGLGEAFEKTGKQSEKANRALSNSGSHAQGATREFSKLARAGGSLSIAYAMVAANVFAIKSAWDYVAKGDALTRMEKASNSLAATSGVVLNDMVKMIQEVSGFSVDYETAMRTAAASTIYGFDTKTIENFTKIARGAAQVMGGDMTDLMNRLVKGTAKQERELLDELGIMVRVDKAQEDYAASLGKTVTQLTALEKQQAFANGVVKNGLDLYGQLGEELSDATPIEKATAAVSNMTRELSQWIALTATPLIARIELKTKSDVEMEKASKSYNKLQDLIKGSKGAVDKGQFAQGLNLFNDALKESEIQTKQSDEALSALIDDAKRLKGITEAGGISDYILWMINLGDEEKVLAEKIQYAAANQEEVNAKMVEGTTALRTYSATLSEMIPINSGSFKDLGKDIAKVSTQIVSTSKAAASIGGEVGKNLTSLKAAVTTSSTLAENFAQAKNEIAALEDLLSNRVVIAIPKLAEQIKAVISKVLESTGSSSKAQLDKFQKVYADQAKFDKEASARAKELAAAGAKSLDSNINSLSVNTANAAIAQRTLDLAKARVAENKKDEEAANIVNEQQAQLVSLAQERKETEYSIGQQAIDNENAIKTATLLLQDQTDASRARLLAEQELYVAKRRVASAGTAGDSASAINARASAEVALKEAVLAEASANDEILSKQKILAAYQKDMSEYAKGHLSYQADIITAQEDMRKASSELDRLNKEGVRYEERRLELKLKQVEAQRQIAELKAEEILGKIGEKQRGSSRGDTGPVSTAEREMREAKERMVGLAKDSTAAGTVAYTNAVEEHKQAKFEYEQAVKAKTREGTDTALGAFGSSQISSTFGLSGEDKDAVLQADALSNYTDALDTIASYNPTITDMISNMGQLTNAFIAFGKGAIDASQLVAPVINTIGSAMTASSQRAIDSIQSQIDMEKKLDGNSEKSKAKIAKLEAEKAAKEKKMAQQTIITQTAAGMAQALGSMPYPYNLVAMGTVAAAGLMALKQAQSGSSIATSTASAPESLSLGERSNRVDTSLSATMGESAYIRGDQGIGSIQKFTPRASGGKAYAGTTILAGENGPEPITLGEDAMVTSNSNARKGKQTGGIQLNINAVDARSFQDLLATDPKFITSLVESSLNERGLSLA